MHRRLRVPSVLERIRQGLLNDPVRGQLDADRKLTTFTLDRELDRKAGIAKLPHERRHVAETRLRGERLVRVTPKHAE